MSVLIIKTIRPVYRSIRWSYYLRRVTGGPDRVAAFVKVRTEKFRGCPEAYVLWFSAPVDIRSDVVLLYSVGRVISCPLSNAAHLRRHRL